MKPQSILATLVLAAASLSAADSQDAGPIEPVVITGSTIKRTDYEGPQTVQILDRQTIDRSGARTVFELIGKLPENAASFSESVFPGQGFSPGAANASLRGLGSNGTLVLINGRRVAPFPLAQNGTDAFIDLNSIPLSSVERVEVLKEGASAVYGSDAIAGVINIILKDSFEGAEVETHYGNATKADSGEFRQTFATGLNNERFHLFLSGNYFHRNSLAAVDRSFSSTADVRRFGGFDFRTENANPGTILLSGDSGAVAVPRGSDGRLQLNEFKPAVRSNGEVRNLFDGNEYLELIPETERWGGLLTFGYNLTPRLELFGEASYQSVQTKTVTAPTQVNSNLNPELTVPASNPFNPFGTPVGVQWRSLETGARRETTDLDAYRYLAGLKFKDLPQNWSVEVAALYSESEVVTHSHGGFLSLERTEAALNDPNPESSLNVFGDGSGINNPKTLRKIAIRPRIDGQAYIWNYDLRANGELFTLAAGPVCLGLTGEYRQESFIERFSESPDAVIAGGGAGSDGSRDVRSVSAELAVPLTSAKWNFPLLRALEISLAERYDEYSDFGSAAKPKLGFKWKPLEGLLFRGSYSEGFRAPSLPQLFTGKVSQYAFVSKPGSTEFQQVPVLVGGNPSLQPENSYSYFLSAIVEPPFLKGLSVEADFYRIEQRNLIGQPYPQDVVDGKAPGEVTYRSNGGIAGIKAPFTNLGMVVVDGVDLDLTYRCETKVGRFIFDTRSSFINSFEVRQPGLANFDLTDSYALPEFKLVGSLRYERGGFSLGATVNYTDSFDDLVPTPNRPSHTIGSWTTVDLQASYAWSFEERTMGSSDSKQIAAALGERMNGLSGWQRLFNGAKLTIGVLNVGDSQPPFVNVDFAYDPFTADPSGRFIYASLQKKFW